MGFEDMESVPMADYLKMIGLKTAVLIACSAKMGALIGGASPEHCELLYKFGYDLGLAFQIADDWLDTYGDPAVFGKAIGGDIVNNKKTWLLTRAFEKAGDMREELLAAISIPVCSDEHKATKVDAVRGIYEKLGIGQEAKHEITRRHAQALGYLTSLQLDSDAEGLLRNYATSLIGRKK